MSKVLFKNGETKKRNKLHCYQVNVHVCVCGRGAVVDAVLCVAENCLQCLRMFAMFKNGLFVTR